VLQGLSPQDWIVLNPPDSLDEGMQVNVKEMPQNTGPATPAGGATPPPGNVPPNTNGGAKK